MTRVNEVVDYVLDAGLYCILNVHHDTGTDEDAWLIAGADEYLQAEERFEGLWTQIAERFKDYDQRLLFEGYNEMLDLLDTHLASLGGPVIVGEWGTFSEDPSLENYCHYADFFVRSAKERGVGTFHWMGISDGIHRSIPVMEDRDISFKVTYNSLWSELNLSASTLNLDDYKGISFELEEAPPAGHLHIKVYGESDGKEQYAGFEGASATLMFDPSVLGSNTRRVTLQYTKDGSFTTVLKRVVLIKADGTEETCTPSVFWGCSLELQYSATRRRTRLDQSSCL